MSAAAPTPYDDGTSEQSGQDLTAVAGRPVVVRRNAGLAALVGGGASAIAIAYLWRATHTGAPLDVVLCLVMALIAAFYLVGLVDARTPLVVADDLGVRIRLGNQWRGLPWEAVRQVVVQPARGPLRDGRLVFSPYSPDRALDGLDVRGRRQAQLNRRLYGAALAVPMGLTTRVAHADGDLVEQLEGLARGRADVVGLEPRPTERPESPVERPTAVEEPTTPVADRTAPSTPVDEEPAPGPVRSVPRGPSADEPATVTDRTVPGIEAEPEDAAAPEQELPASPAAAARPARPRRSLVGEIGTIVSRVAKGRSSATVAPETDTAAEVPDDTDAAGTDRQAEEAASPAPAGEPVPERVRPAATVAPLRDLRRALRAEITRDTPATTLGAAALATDPADRTSGRTGLPEGRELRRPGSVDLVFEPVPTDTRVRPISQLGDAVEPLVIDDFVTEPAYDPVIGPELAAARRRLGLSVDELADRTRIRPHVIESIEVDDFAPCGGDFYARGHLRTLARVLGKDVAPLLEQFDARYATAPINARRVFEAELATGMTGTMRSTAGGPNWSLLVGVVLSLLLVWGVVRLFVTEPAEQLAPPAPVLSGSAGVGRGAPEAGAVPAAGAPVAVVVASARRSLVVVRDADGKVVWAGRVAPGGSHRLRALPPVSVQATHAGGVTVSLAGQRRGPVSTAGGTATRTYRR